MTDVVLERPASVQLLEVLSSAHRSGDRIAILDLPRLTALPLHQAFAEVRALARAGLARIGDGRGDPLTADVEILDAGLVWMKNRSAA